MPIYEFQCGRCKRRFSVFQRGFAQASEPVCPYCGSLTARRLVSRFAVIRGEAKQATDLADPAGLEGLDESDPVSLARYARKMSKELGEEMPPEFDEVVDRLESGQNPDDVEQAMGMSEDGTFGEYSDDHDHNHEHEHGHAGEDV